MMMIFVALLAPASSLRPQEKNAQEVEGEIKKVFADLGQATGALYDVKKSLVETKEVFSPRRTEVSKDEVRLIFGRDRGGEPVEYGKRSYVSLLPRLEGKPELRVTYEFVYRGTRGFLKTSRMDAQKWYKAEFGPDLARATAEVSESKLGESEPVLRPKDFWMGELARERWTLIRRSTSGSQEKIEATLPIGALAKSIDFRTSGHFGVEVKLTEAASKAEIALAMDATSKAILEFKSRLTFEEEFASKGKVLMRKRYEYTLTGKKVDVASIPAPKDLLQELGILQGK